MLNGLIGQEFRLYPGAIQPQKGNQRRFARIGPPDNGHQPAAARPFGRFPVGVWGLPQDSNARKVRTVA